MTSFANGVVAREVTAQVRKQDSKARRAAREKLRQKSRTNLAYTVGGFVWRSLAPGRPFYAPMIDHRVGYQSTFVTLGLLVLFATAGIRETARVAIQAGVDPKLVAACAALANRYTRTVTRRSLAP